MRTFTPETLAVIAHLEMLQSVIQRMAENSRSCKVWSITALSGVLFFAARTAIPWHTLIALVPLAPLLPAGRLLPISGTTVPRLV